MRLPDWLVYTVVLGVIVVTLFSQGDRSEPGMPGPVEIAGPTPYDAEPNMRPPPIGPGPALPDPDPFDERVMVQVGAVENGIGTAFAINRSGLWLTARHVVDGCTRVGLAVGDGRLVPVEEVRASPDTDLALLITDRAPSTVALALDRELRIGDAGYHVGFPQGRSGEASSQLLARSRLVTRGRYVMEEPVLAWVETGRSRGVEGTLAGMSGGPVFDEWGAVVGVTVAESPRRGRIYTAAPDSIVRFIEEQGLVAPGGEARPLAAASYSEEADRMRRELSVVKVVCRVNA
jgi:serine protease Do